MAGTRRQVRVERTAAGEYLARNADGVEVRVGTGDDAFSPVELLLAAVGACTAVDVDVVTSRRAEPDSFVVDVAADKVVDETGGARLQDVEVTFRVRFGDDDAGRQAQGLVPRLVRVSHDVDCTVSRTVELPTRVTARAEDPENPAV